MTTEPSLYLRFCPKCQAKIPLNIKICWGCGKVLDPHLIELATGVKP